MWIPRVLGQNVEKAKADGHPVRGFKDVRDLIASKEIDAITIATPNHWHALATIWACQAGKDVYVEKPVSHNVLEGRQMVEAARKYGRMVQAGTQARSNPDLIEAVAWVRAGNLGKIQYARGTCYKPRMSIGKVRPRGDPAGAGLRPLDRPGSAEAADAREASTTTGTGSTITAMGTWATRESTRWTSPGGFWAIRPSRRG